MTDSPDKPADGAEGRIKRVVIPPLADLGDAHRRRKRTPPPPDDRHGVPTWPTVIGVLSIVMGASGMVWSNLAFASDVLELAPRIAQGDFSRLSRLDPPEVVSASCSTAAGMLAVVAGILLLRRRRGAVGLHLLYAVAGLGGVSAGIWSVVVLASSLGPDLRHLRPFLLVDSVTSLIADMAYPVFVAVWFARKEVRRQWRHLRGRVRGRLPAGGEEAWPAVLAAVAVALGVLAVIDCLGTIGLDLLDTRRALSAETVRSPWIMLPVDAVQIPLSALLIASAALLARRRRAGAVCQVVFAIGAILLVVTGSAIELALTRGLAAELGGPFWVATWVLEMLVTLIYPVFLLIWFARPKIRAQVRSWSGRRP